MKLGVRAAQAKAENLEKTVRSCKATTGGSCDRFHPQVLLDISKETRGDIVKFFEKVEQCVRWPHQACTTMILLIPKNVTSESPIALFANSD